MRKVAVTLLLLGLSLSAQGQGADALEMRLTVKPVLCIVDRRTPTCEMAFRVAWQSNQSGEYCLYNDYQSETIRCWSAVREGQVNEERVVEEAFSYWMSLRDGAERLAAVTVEVLRVDSGDRRRKRRSRHVWDIL